MEKWGESAFALESTSMGDRFGHPSRMDWKSIACIPVYRELAILLVYIFAVGLGLIVSVGF